MHYEKKADMTTKKHNPRNEMPLSLHPLSLEQALGKAMNVQPFLENNDDIVKATFLAMTK